MVTDLSPSIRHWLHRDSFVKHVTASLGGCLRVCLEGRCLGGVWETEGGEGGSNVVCVHLFGGIESPRFSVCPQHSVKILTERISIIGAYLCY